MDKQRYLTFHFGAILYLKCYKSVYVCWSVHPSNKKIQVMYQIVRKLGLMMCLHVCLAEKHNSESKRLKKKIKIKPQHISSYVLMKTHTHTHKRQFTSMLLLHLSPEVFQLNLCTILPKVSAHLPWLAYEFK